MATKATQQAEALIPVELIERRIYLIRGHKVMLDRDLADLYQVETSYLKRQMKRNIETISQGGFNAIRKLIGPPPDRERQQEEQVYETV